MFFRVKAICKFKTKFYNALWISSSKCALFDIVKLVLSRHPWGIVQCLSNRGVRLNLSCMVSYSFVLCSPLFFLCSFFSSIIVICCGMTTVCMKGLKEVLVPRLPGY